MAEYPRPVTPEELEKNFSSIHPLMDATMASYESSRCLYCYDAPCIKACPTAIDIPLFIRQINTGNVVGAAKTIYDKNYFGNACGKVCPTEVLCEGACVYNNQDVKPIEIGRLQSYATTLTRLRQIELYKPAAANGKKVAVIGAGPAGISCACELRLLGYEVDVFERKSMPSGLTLYGCAPYKIDNFEVLEEMAYLEGQLQYKIHYDYAIETQEQLKELEDEYDAIFLGIGLGGTKPIDLKGVHLCRGATEFIEQVKIKPLDTAVGQRVVVIGGGNTAMDAASESARMGAEEVILAYRRAKAEMGAYDFEYELAKGSGVRGLFNVSPVEVLGDDQVRAVRFIRTENRNGQLSEIPGSEFEIPCDMTILATGQSKLVQLLQQIDGLQLDARGRIVIDPKTFQTSHPKYFAGGDAVNGGAEVVHAAADGKAAAKGIHQRLS